MTRMLASVGSVAEAEIALAGGADVIDVDVIDGDGAGLDVVRAVVACVGERRLVSAFAGDAANPADVHALAGVDYVRVGFAGGESARIDYLAAVAGTAKLIAVVSGDTDPDFARLALAGFAGVMLDTRDGAAGSLLDRFEMPRLQGFIEACHAAGLMAGLAGSLETPDIPRLLVLAPDLLGFRRALCGPAGMDLARTQAVRGLIPSQGPGQGTSAVDYRLLSARGQVPAPAGEDVPVDLVFVDDLVLPVFIGAYARERNAPQNVRFAVTASVMRSGRTAEDMRDVFSYDLITDGIRLLIGSGHVALVETLAERIAAMVLGHPRVIKVVVRVVKLETGSGTVGVEIERTRTAARSVERPVVPLVGKS